MNNIFRFWNQNRTALIIGIVALALLIAFVHILNGIIRNENSNANSIELTQAEKELPTHSIIGGETVSLETTKENVEVIEEFVNKCNSGDVTGAYNMLTDDCKELLYQTEEIFKTSYYNMIFSGKKVADIENFLSKDKRHTYLVNYNEDLLSTGSAQNDDVYQDYITIYEDSDEDKISISSLIYKKEIDKESEKDGIKIKIISQAVYKDKEEYQIQVENTSGKTISIVGNQTNSIYLVDTNNVKYNSNIVETASSSYQIPSSMYRTYNLRFKKIYSSGAISDNIIFLDIVTDYNKFKQTPNEIPERLNISVDI